MDATNSDIATGDTEYDNHDEMYLPGDEIEPDAEIEDYTDGETEQDRSDRINLRLNARNSTSCLRDYEIEQIEASELGFNVSEIPEIDVTHRTIETLKRSQR